MHVDLPTLFFFFLLVRAMIITHQYIWNVCGMCELKHDLKIIIEIVSKAVYRGIARIFYIGGLIFDDDDYNHCINSLYI